ncbi:hypothetical protein TcasGA2_TC032820 [Tribolium castaneum]|uniref:Protein TsetseEP domain-containing protein n=1 Tax=Tribolium castaneum TaxID=7070 RepID=A0A139WJ98_TRICA|nr:PREDICTED: uncharacterized protein LOC107397776 [Tribolium castaneum]KYB27972.1 hypothetical protein TcasGA2_TC032820 [Tribolium castaneum]|eukprot:XP_015834700.1 PREDICTED: uncharacterized protein LOC107397776 [Tribolium castaneum]
MLFYLVFCATITQISSLELKLIATLKNDLKILENTIRSSLSSSLDLVEKQLEELGEKSSDVANEAISLLEEHSLDIAENVHLYVRAFSDNEYNVSGCYEGLDDAIKSIHEKGTSKIRASVNKILAQDNQVIISVIPVLTNVQNKTVEIKKILQNCIFESDSKCVYALLGEISNYRHIVPSILETVVNRLQMHVKILESQIVTEVQRIVNGVVGAYTDILFNFLQCIM